MEALTVLASLGGVLAALLACSGTKTVKGPDGREWLVYECSSTANCLQIANVQCPAGYVVGNAEVIGSHTSGSATALGNSTAIASSNTTVRREMMIRCTASPEGGTDEPNPLNP